MFDGKPYLVINDWEGKKTRDYDFIERSLDRIYYKIENTKPAGYPNNISFFSHEVQSRINVDTKIPEPKSELYTPICKTIFRLMETLGIEYDEIARININNTINCGNTSSSDLIACDPHIDHSFRTVQVIFYMNDSDGDTIIYNKKSHFEIDCEITISEDQEVLTRITPQKGKILVFDGSYYHTHYLPSHGYRSIIVVSVIV